MSTELILISHALCPYVQRAAIVLHEKGIAFERRDIDLADKPDWFLAISPLGKTPVLLAGGQAIFESAVICEFLEDTALPALHPADPLQRARHRAWMEFGSALLNNIAGFYNAPDAAVLAAKANELRHRFEQLEAALGPGPFFSGQKFSLVDAVFGPVFRYFEVFDRIDDFGWWVGLPKLQQWREALARRPSVMQAAAPGYAELLQAFLHARGSELSLRMAAAQADARA